MTYTVQLIADDDLPPQQAWAIVQTPTATIAFIKHSCLTGRVLANAWAAYRSLQGDSGDGTRLSLAG